MNTHGSRPLILIEIAVALCFFMVACAVLGSVFSAAGSTGKSTLCNSEALISAEDAIERFCGGSASPEEFWANEGREATAEGVYTWRQTFSGCRVRFIVTPVEEERAAGTIRGFDISAQSGEETLFTLQARRYDGEVNP